MELAAYIVFWVMPAVLTPTIECYKLKWANERAQIQFWITRIELFFVKLIGLPGAGKAYDK